MKKVFKTQRQLISILRERGVGIKKGYEGSRVMRILEKENYYNIINGYKDLFLKNISQNNQEKYQEGTTFMEIYALYTFDRALRHIYLRYLLIIENMFKSVLSHDFSKKYGCDNYLKLDNFQSQCSTDNGELTRIQKRYKLCDIKSASQKSAELNMTNVIKLIGDIQQELARQLNKHNDSVTHYMTKHGYIPFWVLVNILTFGKITLFYSNLKDADKQSISKQFYIQPQELEKYMQMLGLARNRCAHGERFFNYTYKRRISTKTIKNFTTLNLIRDKDGSYNHGTNDAFAIAIIFSQFLTKSQCNDFIKAISTEFDKLNKSLVTISIDNVRKIMGYPSTWKNIIKLVR